MSEPTFEKKIDNESDFDNRALTIIAYNEYSFNPAEVALYVGYSITVLSPSTATEVANALLAAVASLTPAPEHHTGSLGLTGAGNE